jgi:hypothetical protein
VNLQKALNPNPSAHIEKCGSVFAPGNKIMQTENDYDRDGIVTLTKNRRFSSGFSSATSVVRH